MPYLIDTCALSEFTKPRPSTLVEAWFADLEDGTEYVSVLTFGEIEKGIARLKTTRQRAVLERWCSALRDRFGDRVLPVDDAVAREWGRMAARAELAGRPIPVVDGLIAATAIVHGLSVVTRNSSDMARTGAPIVDPWQPR
jgi:predicted nucleic acid-binding protein